MDERMNQRMKEEMNMAQRLIDEYKCHMCRLIWHIYEWVHHILLWLIIRNSAQGCWDFTACPSCISHSTIQENLPGLWFSSVYAWACMDGASFPWYVPYHVSLAVEQDNFGVPCQIWPRPPKVKERGPEDLWSRGVFTARWTIVASGALIRGWKHAKTICGLLSVVFVASAQHIRVWCGIFVAKLYLEAASCFALRENMNFRYGFLFSPVVVRALATEQTTYTASEVWKKSSSQCMAGCSLARDDLHTCSFAHKYSMKGDNQSHIYF
jgi:hypothetical protein